MLLSGWLPVRCVYSLANTCKHSLNEPNSVLYGSRTLAFISNDRFLITNTNNGNVYEVDINGNWIGIFAGGFGTLRGLVVLDDLGLVGAANSKFVDFFRIAQGVNNGGLTYTDAAAYIEISDGTTTADEVLQVVIGENSNEVLLTTKKGKIYRRCIPSTDCSSSRETLMASYDGSLGGSSSSYLVNGIAVLPGGEKAMIETRYEDENFGPNPANPSPRFYVVFISRSVAHRVKVHHWTKFLHLRVSLASNRPDDYVYCPLSRFLLSVEILH